MDTKQYSRQSILYWLRLAERYPQILDQVGRNPREREEYQKFLPQWIESGRPDLWSK